ncbi:MAG: MBL fold metallo-hydrolase [Hyphomonadaceae bacterium]
MARVSLQLFWTGSCRHPERSTRRDGAWRACDYPMYAAVIERAGELIAFDPGYAPRFFEATEPFPDRFYRWTTPAVCPAHASLAAQLGARAEAVTKIVLSHFHADHMAGLMDFPHAEVWCAREAWAAFDARRGFGAVSSGYLKRLAPRDLAARVRFIEDLPLRAAPGEAAPFAEAFDLYGDGSILLMPLPGHAIGQTGALLNTEDARGRFLIADATWSLASLRADAPPPWPVMRFLGKPKPYLETWRALRALAARNPDLPLIPCHCSEAAAREGVAPV